MQHASPTKLHCSALILAKDASETLERAIQSVTFCEQIVVGDDGSSDATIAIARRVGADVIKLSKTTSFAMKRNELTAYAQHDWILWIDADEVVSEILAQSIRAVLSDADTAAHQGYRMRRTDVFLGRKLVYGEPGATRIVRLGRKDAGNWERAVHEVWKIQGSVGELSGELLHYSHSSVTQFFSVISQYSAVEAQMRYEKIDQHPVGSLAHRLTLVRIGVQLFTYPLAKFVKNYLLRGGVLDGSAGLIYAYMMSLHSLFVRIHLFDLCRQRRTL